MKVEQKPFVTREEIEEHGEEQAEENAIQRVARIKEEAERKKRGVKTALKSINTALQELVLIGEYNSVEQLAFLAQDLKRRYPCTEYKMSKE